MSNAVDQSDVAAVCDALSAERMSTYLAAAGDTEAAVELYRWNTVLSGALYETLAVVEVVLRNAINRELVTWCEAEHGHDRWFLEITAARLDRNGDMTNPLLRDVRAVEKIERAVEESGRERGTGPESMTAGMITSQLTFGFWTSLFHKDNSDVWPLFHNAFPHHPDGARVNLRTLHDPLRQLGRIRNRVAHHEPLLRERIDQHHAVAMDLVGWISPASRGWLERYCRVAATLRNRPSTDAGNDGVGMSGSGSA